MKAADSYLSHDSGQLEVSGRNDTEKCRKRDKNGALKSRKSRFIINVDTYFKDDESIYVFFSIHLDTARSFQNNYWDNNSYDKNCFSIICAFNVQVCTYGYL